MLQVHSQLCEAKQSLAASKDEAKRYAYIETQKKLHRQFDELVEHLVELITGDTPLDGETTYHLIDQQTELRQQQDYLKSTKSPSVKTSQVTPVGGFAVEEV